METNQSGAVNKKVYFSIIVVLLLVNSFTFYLYFNENNKSVLKHIQITNAMGKIVFSSTIFQEKIKTQGFAKGLYFVLVKTKDSTFVKKLVVE